MTFTLEDKSPDYIDQLNRIVEEHKATQPILIKIFCKYAEAKYGCIESRQGIFTLLAEEDPGLFIQDELPYLILNPSALRDAKTPDIGEIEFTYVPIDKVKDRLDKFEKILYTKVRDWHTEIGEVRAIWILSGQIWLRSINPRYPGYFFDDLIVKEGWKDIYVARNLEEN